MNTPADINKAIMMDGYKRVADDADERAGLYKDGAEVLDALLDPRLSDEARLEIFGLIQERREDIYQRPPLNQQAELEIQQGIGRSARFLAERREAEERSAGSAQETVHWMLEHDLPEY